MGEEIEVLDGLKAIEELQVGVKVNRGHGSDEMHFLSYLDLGKVLT